MKNGLVVALLIIICGSFTRAQSRVGDPGVIIAESKFDPDYPQMERWANAGVRGGIPYINSFDKTAEVAPGNSAAINAAITQMSNSLSSGQKGLLTLKNGTYTINASVQMKSNVSLIGESRDGVVCSITMSNSDAFLFNNVKNCGLYNLTIKGSWAEPIYNWNYSLDANREFSNDNTSVRLKGGTTDCWLDKVTILNSARDPLRCPADHNTFRDLIVDGCKRKAGGAEGYFFIQGADNVITGCQITHLRHISLQGSNVEYNVVYDNDFFQEISFHSGDNGNNLIANNRITLPVDMPPVAPGDADDLTPVEARNNKPTYFAIMGPWSTQHDVSSHPNFIFRNKCVQDNHNYGPRTPWSDDTKVYFGPKTKGLSNQQRIDNFPAYSAGLPDGGVLYAILLGDQIDVTGVDISKKTLTLKVNETAKLSATVFPDSATNKALNWESTNSNVASVEKGMLKALSEGDTKIIVSTKDGVFKDTCLLNVSGLYKIPVVSISLSKSMVSLMPQQELQLSATVLPEDAYDKSVVWTSSDTAIATVLDGTIVGKQIGEATIYVTTLDGAFKASCKVSVSNSVSYVETFDNMSLVGWGNETFIGNHGFEWTVGAKGITGDINEKGIYFHAGSIGLISKKIPGGIASFSVKCLNKWSEGGERTLELLINGDVYASKKHTGSTQYTFDVANLNIEGEFTLALKNASPEDGDNLTVSIDDVSWTSYANNDLETALSSETKNQNLVYPNPFTSEVFVNCAENTEEVQLINASGSVITCLETNNLQKIKLAPSYEIAPVGLYFVRLISKESAQLLKVIRK